MAINPYTNNSTQVHFDPASGQYYTIGAAPKDGTASPDNFVRTGGMWGSLFGGGYKNYLGQSPFGAQGNQSMIAQMLANRQPYQYNAPSAQQMFPGMGNPMQGTMPQQSQGNPMLGGGNFGAGRFLGQNYANQSGLLGSPSTSMLGT